MISIGVSPEAFVIGPLSIRWYGLAITIGIAVIVLWALREVRREANFSTDWVINAALVGVPSGVIFSRLLHVVDNWNYYSQSPGEIIGASGLTIWGAVLGAAIGIWAYSRVSRFQFGNLADTITPAIVLAQAIGRVGCTLNGCCYGELTSLPWGIVYTNPNSLGYFDSLGLAAGVGLQPTQVYEIIYNLAVFAALVKLRGKFTSGSLFAIYLSLYALWRIAIGFLRTEAAFLFGLNQAQVIGVLVLLVTLPWLVLKARPAASVHSN
jgi:phosphatidylglycerol---prolipoprotein diacylglyceryl transferase